LVLGRSTRSSFEHYFDSLVQSNIKESVMFFRTDGIDDMDELLPILHEKPVWSAKHGWMLVDYAKSCLIGCNITVPFEQAAELFIFPPEFAENRIPNSEPLSRNELQYGLQIWVEPISADSSLREELRGWYRVKHHAIENECGNRFSLDSYGAKWLAFPEKSEDRKK